MSVWKNEIDGSLHDDMDGTALSLSAWPTGLTLLTDAEAIIAQSPTAAQIAEAAWSAYQDKAQDFLDKSDTTILRCYENSIPVPSTWATYRAALRVIVKATSGDATQPLPATPAYPAGS